jgi:hypothetical protein
MNRLIPAFPLLEEPGDWDAMTLIAATCFLEAEAERARVPAHRPRRVQRFELGEAGVEVGPGVDRPHVLVAEDDVPRASAVEDGVQPERG